MLVLLIMIKTRVVTLQLLKNRSKIYPLQCERHERKHQSDFHSLCIILYVISVSWYIVVFPRNSLPEGKWEGGGGGGGVLLLLVIHAIFCHVHSVCLDELHSAYADYPNVR